MEEESGAVRLEIDAARCIGCWECLDACPQMRNTEYPVFARGEGKPEVINEDSCIACLTCQAICRAEALTVSGGSGKSPWPDKRAWAKCRAIF